MHYYRCNLFKSITRFLKFYLLTVYCSWNLADSLFLIKVPVKEKEPAEIVDNISSVVDDTIIDTTRDTSAAASNNIR